MCLKKKKCRKCCVESFWRKIFVQVWGRFPNWRRGWFQGVRICRVLWALTAWSTVTPFKGSLVAQRAKRLPATRETWVRSLGGEDPLEKEVATHSSILAWKNPVDRGAWRAPVHGVARSRIQLSDFTFFLFLSIPFKVNQPPTGRTQSSLSGRPSTWGKRPLGKKAGGAEGECEDLENWWLVDQDPGDLTAAGWLRGSCWVGQARALKGTVFPSP